MKHNCKNDAPSKLIFYSFVFVCLLIATFFTRPKIDEYIFSVSTEFDIKDIWNYCLNYGNGRLLGNVICVSISHLYYIRFLFISLFVLVLAILINQFIFNGNFLSFVPVLLLLLYPSEVMYEAVYRDLPSFTNYTVPIVLLFLTLQLLNNLKIERAKKNILLYNLNWILMSVCAISSCLFSENTTVLVVATLVFNALNYIVEKRKVHISDIVSLIMSVAGTLIMFLIPKLYSVSDKLDSYRGITTSLDDIIYNVVLFSNRISSWTLLLMILSFSLCFVILKTHKTSIINVVKLLVLTLYPLISLFNKVGFFDDIAIFLMTMLYVVAILLSIFDIKDKKTRIISYELCALIFCSIAPVLIIKLVIELGNRLNYSCYVLVLILAVYLFNAEVISEIEISKLKLSRKSGMVIMSCIMIFITCFLVFDNVQTFVEYLENNVQHGAKIDLEDSYIASAWSNKDYLNPQKSVIWPKESWLTAVK